MFNIPHLLLYLTCLRMKLNFILSVRKKSKVFVQLRILLLMAALLVSLTFSQTADAHACHDNGAMESVVQQANMSECEHEKVDHNACCADMNLRHCSGTSVLFIGQACPINLASINFTIKIEFPLDTAVRAEHAPNFFRPPIITA